MGSFKEISELLRKLADAFDNLNIDGNSNAGVKIRGIATKDTESRAFHKKDGSIGYLTKINVRMDRKINDSLFANCIAWTNKFEYQFARGDDVEFIGHFEKNNRGYFDFIIADGGNLKPKIRDAETKEYDIDNEPF